jgi:hypothetical protein
MPISSEGAGTFEGVTMSDGHDDATSSLASALTETAGSASAAVQRQAVQFAQRR